MIKRVGVATIWLLIGMMLVPAGTAYGGNKAAENLDRANKRWRGAQCRSRMNFTVKKGKDRDGWSKCKWLYWSPEGGNSRVLVFVSDGDAVRRRYLGGTIPVGTSFVAVGFAEDKPGGDVHLELETKVDRTPVRVRVYYCDDWVGRVSAKRLDEFERWARFDLFNITSTPDEQLVATQPEIEQAAPGSVVPVVPPVPAGQDQPVSATRDLRVMAASVEPARIAPGSEIHLIVVYAVDGIPPGSTVMVTERRTILHRGQTLTSTETSVARGSGVHESSLPMGVPDTLAAGVYELQATVEMTGLSRSSSAMFEVTAGGR